MKHGIRKTPLAPPLVAVLAILAGCATPEPTLDTSANAVPTFDGLYPVRNSVMDFAWARPDADLSDYSKVMLVGTGISLRPGGESNRTRIGSRSATYFEVSERQREELRKIMAEVFVDELGASDRFQLVDRPGPDVLLVHAGLLDVVSNLPPEPAGRGGIYIRQVGEATLLLELRDPVSGAVLARAIDRRAAAAAGDFFIPTNRAATRKEITRVARFWAQRLREGLESQMASQ